MPSTPRNSPLWALAIVGLFMLAIGGIIILGVLPPGGPSGVAALTTRGGRILVIRLPVLEEGSQKQIVVFSNEPLPRPRIVIFEAVNSPSSEPYTEVQLSLEQWTSIDNVRKQWCAETPRFAIQSSAALFDIGLRCDIAGFRSSKRVQVSLEELPAEFQDLVDMFTSED